DDVHVGLGGDVLDVGQVEDGLSVDDADAHRGDGVGEHRGAALFDGAVLEPPRDGVGERDVGAGDGGGARPTVRLEDVAVQDDGVLPERADVDDGAQRTADEPGDLVGTATDPALDRLAVAACVGGAGQHR